MLNYQFTSAKLPVKKSRVDFILVSVPHRKNYRTMGGKTSVFYEGTFVGS